MEPQSRYSQKCSKPQGSFSRLQLWPCGHLPPRGSSRPSLPKNEVEQAPVHIFCPRTEQLRPFSTSTGKLLFSSVSIRDTNCSRPVHLSPCSPRWSSAPRVLCFGLTPSHDQMVCSGLFKRLSSVVFCFSMPDLCTLWLFFDCSFATFLLSADNGSCPMSYNSRDVFSELKTEGFYLGAGII